jgi:hypothetical protein
LINSCGSSPSGGHINESLVCMLISVEYLPGSFGKQRLDLPV